MTHAPCRAVLVLVFGASVAVAAQPVPPGLSSLAAAGLDRPVVAWCPGEFRSGGAGAFAVAVDFVSGGGRYLVLEPGVPAAVELAAFTSEAHVSCYTPREARALSAVIADSVTLEGSIAPVWATTVVCAFVDNTRAVCWQRSPVSGMFVKVGEWAT